jgi:hypothetical protein
MSVDGPSFYDDDAVFAVYSQRRNRPEGALSRSLLNRDR